MSIFKSNLLVAFIMLCSFTLKAQEKPAPFKLFFEKVYLHTDRDLYAQGDTIWYKAYLLNAQNNTPIGTSGNLYVELIAQDSVNIMSREIIRLDYGAGNGDFALGDSIPSGKYTLRAYTNWMRNFGNNFVFEKDLTIINTIPKTSDITPATENIVPKNRTTDVVKTRQVANTPIVRFYPESGSLVEGVSSLIAVKAENSSGKGIPASGAILNSSGDTVTHFSCDTLGMGKLLLLPLQGQVYHAVLNTNEHKNMNASFPSALAKGFTLRVTHPDSLINVIINCNDAELAEAKGKTFTLTGKHGGKTCFSKPIQITDSQILIKVPDSLFPDGIAAITLSDGQNKPHCERLVYLHHNNTANAITVTTDKAVYQSKEKVTAYIKTNSQKANLSMAVVDAGVVPVQPENIESYLMLRSELKGSIEQPNRYFDTTNVNRYKQLDLLLMTQGWRDFVWRRLADSVLRISYAAEDGFDVSGRVRQKFTDKPIKNMNITLSAFKAQGQKLYAARTDTTGKYSIKGLQLYGPQPLKLTARDDKGNRSGWLLMDSLSLEPLPVYAKAKAVFDTAATANTAIVKALSQRAFDNSKSSMKNGIKLKEVQITHKKTTVLLDMAASTFGYPDQVFTITKKDEYYESLENWLAHNVQGLHITVDLGISLGGGNNGLSRMIVNGREIDAFVPTNAVDSAMQQTIRQPYFELSMDKVKNVVYKHLVGQDPNSGVPKDVYLLYLTVVPNALDNKDFGFETANVNGYYQARTFYKPMYDTQKDVTKPDLRTTIHWEPNITTDAKGEATVTYYNADPKTKVRIIVEGVKASGGPVVGSKTYSIK